MRARVCLCLCVCILCVWGGVTFQYNGPHMTMWSSAVTAVTVCLPCCRANVVGTHFTLYDEGVNPAKSQQPENLGKPFREELVSTSYVRSFHNTHAHCARTRARACVCVCVDSCVHTRLSAFCRLLTPPSFLLPTCAGDEPAWVQRPAQDDSGHAHCS